MKLRIRGESIRLRLTQNEVRSLCDEGRVEETTTFGNERLTYAVVTTKASVADVSARLAGARIEVIVRDGVAQAWAKDETVGIEGADGPLRILVEKDFACLKDRPDEPDDDAFPNPNATC